MAATRVAGRPISRSDRTARAAERALRLVGDARVGLGLLLAVGVANAVAALLPGGPRLLDAWPYAVLLAAVALSGVAAVAVRAPSAWREWRTPAPVQGGAGALSSRIAPSSAGVLTERLRSAGYRVRREDGRRGWAIHGVRRGASRFAGVLSHLALLLVVIGAAVGAAFGSETTFSLLPGEQALLDAPQDGFSAALRLESFDAEFGPDDRPRRLDTTVTFLDAGEPRETRLLRVNEPGDFAGYLVHPWTYGPAARLRVTSLGGDTLLDGAVPLDDVRGGAPVGAAELPTESIVLAMAVTDAAANELSVSAVGADGLRDSVRLRPGERARVADVDVELAGFDAWVTFMSRRDPGLLVLFGGATALCCTLAVAFWLPRRRVTLRPVASTGDVEIVLRGERLDRPADELARLTRVLGAVA